MPAATGRDCASLRANRLVADKWDTGASTRQWCRRWCSLMHRPLPAMCRHPHWSPRRKLRHRTNPQTTQIQACLSIPPPGSRLSTHFRGLHPLAIYYLGKHTDGRYSSRRHSCHASQSVNGMMVLPLHTAPPHYHLTLSL